MLIKMDSESSSISDEEEEQEEIADDAQQATVRPESDKIENDPLPDIRVHCNECKSPIAIHFLGAHRSYHSALSTLGYTSQKTPESLTALLRRRISLAQKWKTEAVTDPHAFIELQRINDAYELLKSHLSEAHEERAIGRDRINLDCRAVGLSCSAGCVLAAGICWSQNPRWKSAMEDTRVFQDYYGNDTSKCFFAIYDGHNGRFAADVAANDLHHYLLKEITQFDPSTSCTCAVNLADVNDLSSYPMERAVPIVRKDSIRHILHEESANVLQQVMHTCPYSAESDEPDQTQTDEQETRIRGTQGPNTRPEGIVTDEQETTIHRTRDPYTQKMMQAFKRAFTLTDHALSFGVQEESRVRWSGCSALACMVMDRGEPEEEPGTTEDCDEETSAENQDDAIRHLGDIYIANAGNVHAVLSRGGAVHQLTRDHSPANPTEKQRLLQAGVSIHLGGKNGKANGILEATRGLGNHGDPLLKSAILCDPHSVNTKIDRYAEFLILASNGLWEALTNEEAVEVVQAGIDLVRREIKQQETELRKMESRMAGTAELAETDPVSLQQDEACQEAGRGTRVQVEQADVEGQNSKGVDQLVTSQSVRSKVASVGAGEDLDLEIRDAGPQTPDEGGSTSKDDNLCRKIGFEEMIDSLVGTGGENAADVATLAKVQNAYAKSRLNITQSKEERVRSIAERVSERLVQAAILAGARDNITVMVVLLPGCMVDAGDVKGVE